MPGAVKHQAITWTNIDYLINIALDPWFYL